MNNNSSYFIKNKGLFGSFPSQSEVAKLESEGVKYFIDLTYKTENNINPYTTKYKYISYPIVDRYIPTNIITFSHFINKIVNIIKNLKNNELIYIHCKGGHGRSGIVVACILCHLYSICPLKSIELTNMYHNKRKTMKDKWRLIGSPQTFQQKKFIYKLFKPLKIYNVNYNQIFGFSINSIIHLIDTDETAIFDIIKNKLIQNPIKLKNFIKTGLRPIIIMDKSINNIKIQKQLSKVRIYYINIFNKIT